MSSAAATHTSSKSNKLWRVAGVILLVVALYGIRHLWHDFRGVASPRIPAVPNGRYDVEDALNKRLSDNTGDVTKLINNKNSTSTEVREAVLEYKSREQEHDTNLNLLNSRPSGPVTALIPTVAAPQVANLEDFRLISANPVSCEYEFQLDARVIKQDLGLEVCDGDTVEFWTTGQVCAGPGVPCTGPNGQGARPMDITKPEDRLAFKVDEFPVPTAYFQALCAYIGGNSFQIGEHKVFTVPSGTGKLHILVGNNLHPPEAYRATGGQKLKIKITRSYY